MLQIINSIKYKQKRKLGTTSKLIGVMFLWSIAHNTNNITKEFVANLSKIPNILSIIVFAVIVDLIVFSCTNIRIYFNIVTTFVLFVLYDSD